jgi:hypothetical protein
VRSSIAREIEASGVRSAVRLVALARRSIAWTAWRSAWPRRAIGKPGAVSAWWAWSAAALTGRSVATTLSAARRTLASILGERGADLGPRYLLAQTGRAGRQCERRGRQVTRLVLLSELGDELAVGSPAAFAKAGQHALGELLALTLLDFSHSRYFRAFDTRAGGALNCFDLAHLPGRHKGERLTGSPGSPRAANAVDVVLRILRQVKVHDMGDGVNINAACRDVGRYQNFYTAVTGGLHCFVTGCLRHVSMQSFSPITSRDQVLGELVCHTLCGAEDESQLWLLRVE